MDLNKEAEDFAEKILFESECLNLDEQTKIWILGCSSVGFIEGTNSKHVQAKILQAQIDVLKEVVIKEMPMPLHILIKISELEQQLKQLDNE